MVAVASCTSKGERQGPCQDVILVVDDDQDTLDVLKIVLENEGLLVQTATNGKEAVERAAQQIPSLVTLDWDLAPRSGESVARDLRETCGSSIPIILISGNPYLDEKAARVGAFDYLQKPFVKYELVSAVHRALANARYG